MSNDVSLPSKRDAVAVGAHEFVYPEEWYDDQKMDVMFAPFRDRHRYPKAWEQKMKFWSKLVWQKIQFDGDVTIDVKTLCHKFKRKDRLPACFNDVLAEIIQSNSDALKKASDLRDENTWMSWGYATFIKAPVMWGMRTMLNISPRVEGEFVVMSLLQSKSEEVLSVLHTGVDDSVNRMACVTDYRTLKHRVAHIGLTDSDYDLVLTNLEQSKKIFMQPASDGNMLIKFAPKGEESVKPVQKSDTEIIKIERVVGVLETEIDALTKSVHRLTEDAREYIRQGLKTTAYHTLRKRKRTQRLIDKKYNTLDVLHGLLERMQSSASDKMVMDAYAAGTAVLNTYLHDRETGVEKIDDILDNLSQAIEEYSEFNETLSGFSTSVNEFSDADLQGELDQLLASDADIDEVAEKFGKISSTDLDDPRLPDVPTASPRTSPNPKHTTMVPAT